MRRGTATLGVLAIILGASLGASFQASRAAAQNGPSAAHAPDERAGRALYERHCLRCHGPRLDGNGPDGLALIVPPADLQSVRSRAKTDVELLTLIAQGIVFSPMHGWRDRLTEAQMLDILGYIRARAPFIPLS